MSNVLKRDMVSLEEDEGYNVIFYPMNMTHKEINIKYNQYSQCVIKKTMLVLFYVLDIIEFFTEKILH